MTAMVNKGDDNDLLENRSTITFDEMMTKVKYTVNKHGKYSFLNSDTRNIILMGRTRTGKSTVAKTLEKAEYIPDKSPSLFAETKEIEFHKVATIHTNGSFIYNFNMIDTPGFYDQSTKQGKKLSNEYIKSIIDKCIHQDMTNIHCFAFVFNLYNGINTEDIQSMVYVKESYPHLKEHMILLLTHCEETTKEKRKDLVKKFFEHETVMKHGLPEYFGAGIYYMGCLRYQLHENPDKKAAGVQIENVMEMRETLIDFLINRKEPFNIHRYMDAQPKDTSSGICNIN